MNTLSVSDVFNGNIVKLDSRYPHIRNWPKKITKCELPMYLEGEILRIYNTFKDEILPTMFLALNWIGKKKEIPYSKLEEISANIFAMNTYLVQLYMCIHDRKTFEYWHLIRDASVEIKQIYVWCADIVSEERDKNGELSHVGKQFQEIYTYLRMMREDIFEIMERIDAVLEDE